MFAEYSIHSEFILFVPSKITRSSLYEVKIMGLPEKPSLLSIITFS